MITLTVRRIVFVFGLCTASTTVFAQQPRTLTLDQAEQLAINNHPRIASASFNAQAAGTAVKQVNSALQPLLTGNLTSVGADRDSTIAAGALQAQGLASRAATGVGFSQLITDFGRTSKLADTAKLRASAQDRNVSATRAQVLLQVEQAYYNALASDELLKVAQGRVEMQRVTLRQVKALAESSLKSTLDVSFAEVAVSEAELGLYQAENNTKASHALLSAAIGQEQENQFALADVPLPGRVSEDAETLVQQALKDRPDVSVASLNRAAAERFVDAEKKLRYPAISVVGAFGVVPIHQSNFASQYSGAGLNITIPFLNGGLFTARRQEAEFRALGAERDVAALTVQVAAGVRVARIEADNAWRKIDVTARLVDQAGTALRLARARYEIGLSGILELTQAQLSLTSAQIASASAKYDYLIRVANLNYATGVLR